MINNEKKTREIKIKKDWRNNKNNEKKTGKIIKTKNLLHCLHWYYISL